MRRVCPGSKSSPSLRVLRTAFAGTRLVLWRCPAQYGLDQAFLGGETGAPLSNWFEESIESGDQLLLNLNVTHLALSIARLQVLNLGPIIVERVVVDEDRISLNAAGNVSSDAFRVCVHGHHFSLHGLGVVAQEDGIAQRLTHLRLPGGARQCRHGTNQSFWHRKDGGERIVEPSSDFTSELNVGELVL